MQSRESIEKEFKIFKKLIFGVIVFMTIVSLYQHEKWKDTKKVLKAEVSYSSDELFIIEYKYFSLEQMCWVYRVSTPTSRPVKYYEWNGNKKILKEINKNEY